MRVASFLNVVFYVYLRCQPSLKFWYLHYNLVPCRPTVQNEFRIGIKIKIRNSILTNLVHKTWLKWSWLIKTARGWKSQATVLSRDSSVRFLLKLFIKSKHLGPDSWAKAVSNIDSNSLRYLTFKVITYCGPNQGCGYALWSIVLSLVLALSAPVTNLVLRSGP